MFIGSVERLECSDRLTINKSRTYLRDGRIFDKDEPGKMRLKFNEKIYSW